MILKVKQQKLHMKHKTNSRMRFDEKHKTQQNHTKYDSTNAMIPLTQKLTKFEEFRHFHPVPRTLNLEKKKWDKKRPTLME